MTPDWEKLDAELRRLLRKKMSETVDVSDSRGIEELDSLAVVELIAFVEEEEDLVLEFSAVRGEKTVGGLKALITRLITADAEGTVHG